MGKEYIYFSSIVNYRQEILPDGRLGRPEVESGWSRERGAPKKKKTTPTQPVVENSSATISEVEF